MNMLRGHRVHDSPGRRRSPLAGTLLAALLPACSAAPSQDLLGSYFPSWIICALAGIAGAVVVRRLLVALGIDRNLPAPLLTYLILSIALAFSAWVIWLD